MESKFEVLNAINNQCLIVQKNIARHLGVSKTKDLDTELLMLYELLKKYFDD